MEWQTDLTAGTVVSFPSGRLTETARVVFAAPQGDRCLLVTDRTPFHPLSLTWPDQPGDRGTMTTSHGQKIAVLDSQEALLNAATGTLFTAESAASIKRNDPDIHPVVLHIVDGPASPVGSTVTLSVDKTYRDALSLQHSGVHLTALALNECAAPFWTKDVEAFDSLGAPNLDKAAVTQSTITVNGSTDHYRVGKTLRKKGFDLAAFVSDLPARTARINDTLRRMVADPAPVKLTPGAGFLGDRRMWSTRLDGTEVTIPCGGTHVTDLAQLVGVSVSIAPSDSGFIVTTVCKGRVRR